MILLPSLQMKNQVSNHMNNQTLQIWPNLESEESAARRKNRQGQGLKIIAQDQMISRLPISLAKFKAGNNSEKLSVIVFFVLFKTN